MGFPTIFGIVIIFVVWFAYQRKKGAKDLKQNKEDFWETEAKANSVRKKNIDSLDYIVINPDSFPFPITDDPILNECREKLVGLSEKKVYNLTGITNTQLKLMYGSPNLTLLSECDENFTFLVRTLHLYGKRLLELGYEKDAQKVLEFAIKIRTDISDTYKLLCGIYKKNGDTAKIENLLSVAESLNSLNKKNIITHLCSME